MITTERQYKITTSERNRLQQALDSFDPLHLAAQGIAPVIVEAQRNALLEQITDLDRDIKKYEDLKSGGIDRLSAENLLGVGNLLIDARIASGLTQKDLAERLGMKEQQIQRYEQERYRTANLTRLEAVAAAMAIRLDTHMELRIKQSVADLAFDPKRLPAREMKKRGWLADLAASGVGSDFDLAAEFVRRSGAGTRFRSLQRQNVRAGGISDEYALLAWKARILQKARELEDLEFREELNTKLIGEIVRSSAFPDGPARAVSMLRQSGVAIVFERHLPHTHLDGAALLLETNIPVIGMTLRYNRLDNFWFVLLHEIAHIIKHRRMLEEGFFDDIEGKSEEVYRKEENEADEFAEECLIPNEVWASSLVRFASSRDSILHFAERHNVSPAIVAGRIRNERRSAGGYRLFSDLLGSNTVRQTLSHAGYLEDG